MAARVILRDVTADDAALLERWATDGERSPFNDFGLPFQRPPRAFLERGPLRTEHSGLLVVELAGDRRPIGTVSWHRVDYGPNLESGAWNIGIELRPEWRGLGLGSEAQQLLARYLFETTRLQRVEATTDVENLAEQRALEKAGFQREGIQRAAQYRQGAYHDVVTYAILRDELEERMGS